MNMATKSAQELGNIKILPDETAPEILADAIVKISAAAQTLLNSKLKRRTILVLLQSETKLAMRDIETVLDAAANLSKTFVKP